MEDKTKKSKQTKGKITNPSFIGLMLDMGLAKEEDLIQDKPHKEEIKK